MATKEDRYPKEYKSFPNDKAISRSPGNNSNSNYSNSSSSGKYSQQQQPKQQQQQPKPQQQQPKQQQQQPKQQQQQSLQLPQQQSKQHHYGDFRDKLKNTISQHMRGFRASNVITYQRFRDKTTWQRPGELAEQVACDEDEQFTADPKEAWPIMKDMNVDVPAKELTRQHRVTDRNWTVPASKKKFKQPEPVYPQSTGVKLRKIEDIMNDYSKKATPQATSPALSLPSKVAKPTPPNANSIPRVAEKSQRPLQAIPDKIKGVLQNLKDTRRKPAATTASSAAAATAAASAAVPAKNQSSKSSSNSTVRKVPSWKTSAISPQDPKPKPKARPVPALKAPGTKASATKAAAIKAPYPPTRPRVASKAIPMEKEPQFDNDSIPDLIEARKYILGHDEAEFRNITSLQEMPEDNMGKKRPELYIHLQPTPNANHMPKSLEQHTASALVNNSNIKQEKALAAAALSASNKKTQANSSTQFKSTTASLPLDAPLKSVGKTNSKKQSQSDQSQAPTRTSTPATKSKNLAKAKEETESREETATYATPKSNDKQVCPSSVSADFLRSTKIPKRSNSLNKSSHDAELEEGETISPSPSPIRTSSRASHADVDSRDRPSAPSNARKAASTTVPATAASAKPNKRREEERAALERERDRDRYRDDSSSATTNRRERVDRRRSRSRSRSPVSKPQRSESRNRRSPAPPASRRQTSAESSHRRRSPPPARSEREPALDSVAANSSSTRRPEREPIRPEREARPENIDGGRSEKADKLEQPHREPKRKSFHDSTVDDKTPGSQPPAKRLATSNTNKDGKSLANNTNSTTVEKDKNYTSNSNPPASLSSSSLSSSSNQVKKPAPNAASTPKSVATPNTATSTTSSSSSASTLTSTTLAGGVPASDKALSATAPNAETPEQYKIFTIMFKQLAHANKRRGDKEKDPLIQIVDHFHALCDYILNFYYVDKANANIPFKQASVAWKSLFPFCDSLLLKLQTHRQDELHGLCVRLIALIRYYIYSRMENATRPLLTKYLSGASEDGNITDRKCIEMTDGLLREHEKAERCYKESEKHMTFGKVASQFPATFKDVCVEGNILAGITLGGEAGVSVAPMFPFTPYSPLHHAAIVSKCILSEYVAKNNLSYCPITKPEEFMKNYRCGIFHSANIKIHNICMDKLTPQQLALVATQER
ncbi:hypothetical protein [Parasitella parasitica]|uniref:Uncharacterized protein n=1 Tax=Parasitella parasitica TaxID=35722 RepID=A0A0B7NCS0_9FUNG|nr:hypothetical protein [Parasitella parasitica]